MAEFVYRDQGWLPSLFTKQSPSPRVVAKRSARAGSISVCLLLSL